MGISDDCAIALKFKLRKLSRHLLATDVEMFPRRNAIKFVSTVIDAIATKNRAEHLLHREHKTCSAFYGSRRALAIVPRYLGSIFAHRSPHRRASESTQKVLCARSLKGGRDSAQELSAIINKPLCRAINFN